jgi:hypothetical protein
MFKNKEHKNIAPAIMALQAKQAAVCSTGVHELPHLSVAWTTKLNDIKEKIEDARRYVASTGILNVLLIKSAKLDRNALSEAASDTKDVAISVSIAN